MTPLTLADVAVALHAQVGRGEECTLRGVSIDTRTVRPGDLFFAIPGARIDPHDLIHEAVAAGAAAVVVQRDLGALAVPNLRVDDSQVALADLARWYWQTRLNCITIGITGSSGKTTTKDMIAQILESAGPTVAPQGSFNTEVGVPLTVLAAEPETRFLVLEMGMRGHGHIEYLTRIATPDVAVVTNVGHAHVGMLGSIDEIARAKSELITGLSPRGVAILNADDARVLAMQELTSAQVISFGRSDRADIRAERIRVQGTSTRFRVVDKRDGSEAAVSLAFPGEHNVANALAAVAAARACGIDLTAAAGALGTARLRSAMRMEVLSTDSGIVVINDAYNANPESTRAAVDALVSMSGRTWAVLGEMRELGEESPMLHAEIGRYVAERGVSRLICVGEGTRPTHEEASRRGMDSLWLPEADDAVEVLRAELSAGDVVLVKASRSIGLESVVHSLVSAEGGGST